MDLLAWRALYPLLDPDLVEVLILRPCSVLWRTGQITNTFFSRRYSFRSLPAEFRAFRVPKASQQDQCHDSG
jgi:hypothetical protein